MKAAVIRSVIRASFDAPFATLTTTIARDFAALLPKRAGDP